MNFRHKALITVFTIVLASIFVAGCSGGDDENAQAQLIDSQYCEKYLDFDASVAILEYTEQLTKLKAIRATSDLPAELAPSYDRLIESYENFLDGQDRLKNEEENEAASQTISIHARDNCGLYEDDR